MKNLNISQIKPFLLPVLVLIIILLASWIFLRPQLFQIIGVQRRLSADRKTLAGLTQKVAVLEGLDQAELLAKNETVLRVLPPEKDIPLILLTIKSLSWEAGITLKEVEVDPGELSTASAQIKDSLKRSLPFLVFRVVIEGEKDNIKNFFDAVELTAPLMRIKKISLTGKETNLAEVMLTLNVFFLPPPQKLSAIDAPVSLLSEKEETIYRKISSFKSVRAEETLPSVQTGKENPFTF